MGPCDLDAMLRSLPGVSGEMLRLLETRDDAAVIRLSDDLCLVQTVDFFTPIVDDGYWFGQVAAANSFSDIYAMGARPLTAMNLVAYPVSLGPETLNAILRGGAEKVAEAGAELAGGHSVDDKEPKYGLSVTGVARPDEIVYNAGAQPGDKLVLTKRLGIGVLASALKKGLIGEDEMMPTIREAAALNAGASRAMLATGVHAGTDVSGFGLLGHLGELLDASGVAARVELAEVPQQPRVLDFIEQGVYAAGLRANRDYLAERVAFAATGARGSGVGHLDDPRVLALFDPQTSGGLLIAAPPDRLEVLFAHLTAEDVEAWTIGEIADGAKGRVTLVGSRD
jgi:selenide,water dikinase